MYFLVLSTLEFKMTGEFGPFVNQKDVNTYVPFALQHFG